MTAKPRAEVSARCPRFPGSGGCVGRLPLSVDDTAGEKGYRGCVSIFASPLFQAFAGGVLLSALGYALIHFLT